MFGSSSAIRTFLGTARFPGHLRGKRSLGAGGRDREREARAATGLAFDPQAAAEMLDDLPADVKPEPAAMRLASQRIAHLVELAEDLALVLGAHAAAVVADVDAEAPVALDERDIDAA